MLAAMAKESVRRRLMNIRPVLAKWEEYMPEEKYDLAFSAMSPAIKDGATLRKLESCSARSCCLVTYADNPDYGPITGLWEPVTGERKSENAFLYHYPYNLLKETGRAPVVEKFRLDHEKLVAVDRLVQEYVTYFSIFTKIDARKESLIREYFESASIGGTYKMKTRVGLAAICWDVEGDHGHG